MDSRGGRESTFVRERLEACDGSHPCYRRSQGLAKRSLKAHRASVPSDVFEGAAARPQHVSFLALVSQSLRLLSLTMGRRIWLLRKGVNRSFRSHENGEFPGETALLLSCCVRVPTSRFENLCLNSSRVLVGRHRPVRFSRQRPALPLKTTPESSPRPGSDSPRLAPNDCAYAGRMQSLAPQ